ncbi:hypothetical protein AB0E04_26940 [Streptomyces sp. NPDC048251]|uniref:hypothetical protein n=1 Tax=Streptomyces sp. NPDC048251 TaxID=3154501 RepID=UPI00343149E2
MSLAGNVDVVVIGFGIAGATAAVEAADAGARVLALDGRGALRPHSSTLHMFDRPPAFPIRLRRLPRAAQARAHAARAEARSAALAVGVRVRTSATVCELLVDGGRVSGVGYAALDASSATALRYSCLNRVAERLQSSRPGSLGRALGERAEEVWERESAVESTTCSSVVLAIDPARWDFVGPAVWATVRAAERSDSGPETPARRANPSPVGGGSEFLNPAPTELTVRAWCATQSGGGTTDRLHIGRATGAVLTGDGHRVPGLYSAVPSERAGISVTDVETVDRKIATGRRAGRAAGTSARDARQHLSAGPGNRLETPQDEWPWVGATR